MGILEKLAYGFKENTADSTSMITITMPLNSGIELFGAGMNVQRSLTSRAYNVALAYAGLTRLVKIRDYTKKRLGLENGSKILQGLHDITYGVVLGPLIKTGIYLQSGETDWRKIGISVAGTLGIVGALAFPLGWLLDVGRDCWNLKESNRTPNWIKRKSKAGKKALAVGALAISTAVTAGLYGYKYNLENRTENQTITLENKI